MILSFCKVISDSSQNKDNVILNSNLNSRSKLYDIS
jgi:hypothetical protein